MLAALSGMGARVLGEEEAGAERCTSGDCLHEQRRLAYNGDCLLASAACDAHVQGCTVSPTH
jgi:hypothetical protein